MKVAYHFLSVHPDLAGLGSGYGYQIMRKVLRKILDRPVINMHTKVFIGDLLLDQYSRERETTEDGYIERFSREKNSSLFDRWLHPQSPVWSVWSRLMLEIKEAVYDKGIFVMCFESLDQESAQSLHSRFEGESYYLGAMEVDDSSPAHWVLYSASLVPQYRLHNGLTYVFWDGMIEDWA